MEWTASRLYRKVVQLYSYLASGEETSSIILEDDMLEVVQGILWSVMFLKAEIREWMGPTEDSRKSTVAIASVAHRGGAVRGESVGRVENPLKDVTKSLGILCLVALIHRPPHATKHISGHDS